jgi:hypothetical protein
MAVSIARVYDVGWWGGKGSVKWEWCGEKLKMCERPKKCTLIFFRCNCIVERLPTCV